MSGKHGSEEGSAGKRRSLSDYYLLEAAGLRVQLVNSRQARQLAGRPKTDPLTELPREVPEVSGRMGILAATVADRDHARRCAA